MEKVDEYINASMDVVYNSESDPFVHIVCNETNIDGYLHETDVPVTTKEIEHLIDVLKTLHDELT